MRRLLQLRSTVLLLLALLAWPAAAEFGNRFAVDELDLADVTMVVPGADRIGASEGEVPARPVYRGDVLLGYVFLTDEIRPIPAYSGRPIRTLVGLDLAARISGLKIVAHEEPILVIGVTDQHLDRYIDQYRGLSVTDRVRIGAHNREGYIGVDGITGATITVMVLNSAVMQSAAAIARALSLPRLPADAAAASSGAEAGVAGASATPVVVADDTVLWQELWLARPLELGILVAALMLLTVVLFFQDWLVEHPVLFDRFRTGYLVFTVGFIGFYCLAQLSIINFLAFMQILFGGFTWESLMLDPIIFILWGFLAVSILLWGRGVYCGWLCPFGALQELVGKVAERLQVRQYNFPPMIHERLWAIKYLLLLSLFGLSLDSMTSAARLAEVEPFKTTFVLRFDRQWWFVVYALGLLLITLFQSKFYCKYLCPLGAGLSVLSRFRIFDWLRRRNECGSPCQTCATQCSIGAISPTGKIIDHECHYCLECQVTYWDEHRCPPLVEKRKRREKRERNKEKYLASSGGSPE